MGFFDMFRREPPVAGRAELTDFLDAQAAFLAQKGIRPLPAAGGAGRRGVG